MFLKRMKAATPKLADLPVSHADDVQQPCDWCGRSILHEHPPGDIFLQVGNLAEFRSFESRHWRVCEQCVDLLIELVRFRTAKEHQA